MTASRTPGPCQGVQKARGGASGRSKYGVDNSDAGKAARTVNGILFDSKREAARYQQLVMLEREGLIIGLQLQQRYPLNVCGALVGTYVADFVYRDMRRMGEAVIEDTKGVRTREYILKAKLMQALYKVKIRET